uniref:Uncharacterized protein n=1 Tax=Anopheles melas TaxID=34690 RepID=A0A182UGW4_9DIPT
MYVIGVDGEVPAGAAMMTAGVLELLFMAEAATTADERALAVVVVVGKDATVAIVVVVVVIVVELLAVATALIANSVQFADQRHLLLLLLLLRRHKRVQRRHHGRVAQGLSSGSKHNMLGKDRSRRDRCSVEVIGMIVVVCLFIATFAPAPNFCPPPPLCIGTVLLVIVMDMDECATEDAVLAIAPEAITLMFGPAVEDMICMGVGPAVDPLPA